MRVFLFVQKCPKCGYSTTSDSPDFETCPIPWRVKDGRWVSDQGEGSAPCGGEYEDGPYLDWWLLPDEAQAAIRGMMTSNSETPTGSAP